MRKHDMIMRSASLVLAGVLSLVTLPAGAAPAGHVEGYVPVAAHGPGKFGSFWTTDLWIYRQSATFIHLWFNPEGGDNTARQSVVVPLTQPVTYLPDIVEEAFGTQGKGSVHYLADGQVVVLSRTWTPGSSGGSYGHIAYGMPAAMASMPGGGPSGALRMQVNQASGSRANLGLLNVAPAAATVTVEILSPDGQPAPGSSTFTVDLLPFGMRQVDDIFARLTPGERQGLVVRASVTGGDGAILAYLAEVDNTTNSGSYQEAFRFGY